MWIPAEIKDPVVYHHPTRKSVGYFGAVRLRDGKFMFHRAEKFNAESFFLFVRDLRLVSCHSGRKVEVILDNAGYHHAKLHRRWREKSASRFATNYLPPYSPELNPIEWVWKLVRRLAAHNRHFSSIEEITRAVLSIPLCGGMSKATPFGACAQLIRTLRIGREKGIGKYQNGIGGADQYRR